MKRGMFHAPDPQTHGGWRHHVHHHPEFRRDEEYGGLGPHQGGRGGRGKHGGRGGAGHHGGRGRRMERGALRAVLLDLLREGPKHGYELIRSLEERTHGQYAPSPGVLYPTLQLLNDLALVESEQDAGRRVYRLTETGHAELETRAAQVAAFWDHYTAEAPSAGIRHEVGFLQDALDDLGRTVWTRLRDAVARGDERTIRRVREAVEKCQNDVRAVIASEADTAPLEAQPESNG